MSLTPYNLNQKMRDDDVEDKLNPLNSYLIKRPKLFFENVDIVDKDLGNLMIIFKINI